MTGRHRRTEDDEDDEGRRLYEWHTVDFHPASAADWLVLALDDEGHVGYQRLPGWLVQEHVAYGSEAAHPLPESLQSCRPLHRVVGAVHQCGELLSVYEAVSGFWRIIPDTAAAPGAEEIGAELQRREKLK